MIIYLPISLFVFVRLIIHSIFFKVTLHKLTESQWTQRSKTLIGCLQIDGLSDGHLWIAVTSLFSYLIEVSAHFKTSHLFCIIVIFHLFSYKDPQRHIIKRIIGLEGDIIRNDKYSFREVPIPKGYCWVEGDNPAASSDSIKYGPSKGSSINEVI